MKYITEILTLPFLLPIQLQNKPSLQNFLPVKNIMGKIPA